MLRCGRTPLPWTSKSATGDWGCDLAATRCTISDKISTPPSSQDVLRFTLGQNSTFDSFDWGKKLMIHAHAQQVGVNVFTHPLEKV